MDMNKFFGKKQEFVVQGERVILEPFKGKELGLLMALEKNEDENALIDVVFSALKKNNDVKREDVENFTLAILTEFVEKIMAVNGFEDAVKPIGTNRPS